MEFTDEQLLNLHKVTKQVIDKACVEFTSVLMDMCSTNEQHNCDMLRAKLAQAQQRIDELELALQKCHDTMKHQQEQRKQDVKKMFRMIDQVERSVKRQQRG